MLIVVSAAEQTRLTTVSAVRSRLAIGDDVVDSTIMGWIDAASQSIADFCERTFGRQTLREIYQSPGCDGRPLRLRLPVTEILSVTLDGAALDAATWHFDPVERSILRLVNGEPVYWSGSRAVVEYVTGWILPGPTNRDLPANVEDACLQLVAMKRFSGPRDPLLRSETVEGVGSSSYVDYRAGAGGMPQQAAEMLHRFIRPSVG